MITTPEIRIHRHAVDAVLSSRDGNSRRWLHYSDVPFKALLVKKRNKLSVKFKYEFPWYRPGDTPENREIFKFKELGIIVVLESGSRRVHSITLKMPSTEFTPRYNLFDFVVHAKNLIKKFDLTRDKLMVLTAQHVIRQLMRRACCSCGQELPNHCS